MYSAEWSQVVKNYEAYKESLSVFRKYISYLENILAKQKTFQKLCIVVILIAIML